jgi:peptide/nickel transport system ATP-binding protein
MCDRLMVMREGKAVESLAAADLAARRVSAAYTHKLLAASDGFRRA